MHSPRKLGVAAAIAAIAVTATAGSLAAAPLRHAALPRRTGRAARESARRCGTSTTAAAVAAWRTGQWVVILSDGWERRSLSSPVRRLAFEFSERRRRSPLAC